MKKRYLFLFSIIFIITIFIKACNIPVTHDKNPEINSSNMIVHYIDVGQGDSILVQVNNKNLLIDAGPKSSKNKLLAYLNSLYIDKLDYVIATHPHEDHIGNMDTIIKKYDVKNFYAPKVESTTKSFEKMVEALKSKNLKINVIKKGLDSIDLGCNTNITVFSPTQNSYDNLNNYSPVIRIEYGKTSFLFTGDAEKEVEKEISEENYISSDVLKVGHHGSSTSSTDDFINKVNPSIGVISVGEDNTYNHPNNDILKRLQVNKTIIYRTDIEGTIVISSDGSIIKKL